MNKILFYAFTIFCVVETFIKGFPLQQQGVQNYNAFEEIINSNDVFNSVYSDYVQKHQSLYPECNFKNNVLEENHARFRINKTSQSMYMQFSLDHLQHSGFVIKPLAGTLNLFQKGSLLSETNLNKNLQNSVLVDNSRTPSSSSNITGGEHSDTSLPTIEDNDPLRESDILKVTISLVKDNFIIPLDSKNISRQTPKGGKWIGFDILTAVEEWSNNVNRNLGIILDVQHLGQLVPANSVFQAMNCSDSARHPYPSFLGKLGSEVVDNIKVEDHNSAFYSERLNIKAYPILDVTIVEIPKTEISNEASSSLSLFFVVNFESFKDLHKTSMTLSDAIKEGALSLSKVYPMAKSIETAYDMTSSLLTNQNPQLPVPDENQMLQKLEVVSDILTGDARATRQDIQIQQKDIATPLSEFNAISPITKQVQLTEEEFNNFFGE